MITHTYECAHDRQSYKMIDGVWEHYLIQPQSNQGVKVLGIPIMERLGCILAHSICTVEWLSVSEAEMPDCGTMSRGIDIHWFPFLLAYESMPIAIRTIRIVGRGIQ
jgi:hypothetical protein